MAKEYVKGLGWTEVDPTMEYVEYKCPECGKAFTGDIPFLPDQVAGLYKNHGRPISAYCDKCAPEEV